ncbi:MAG TPA: CRTAC1 family protein, partial [Puia sp.]|nr:CRTAC1 family protein [Puia sp.]
MRRKIFIAAIAIPILLLLTSVTYTCIRNYCANLDAYRIYKKALVNQNDKNNQFTPQAELDFYDSILNTTTSQNVLFGALLFKSTTFLKMGREKDAVNILEPLLQTESSQPNNEKFHDKIKEDLALAYLRMGERNNCVSNHCSGSCIFPIQGKGIYIDPYASQKSIRMYQSILQKDSSDLTSRWLLNIAYMTTGEYPAKVPTQWLIPGLDADTSSYKLKAFQEMAGELQINGPGNMAGGSIVDDFNNDGYLDIITSTWCLDDPMHYYKNNADGTFTDVAKEAGLSEIKGGLNMIQADYNNDGFADILVLRGAWLGERGKQPNTLLKNNGDGTFTDVTIESGLLSFHPTEAATWADFNNDGWLDLFIGNETQSTRYPHFAQLYINNQDGTFTDVARQSFGTITNFTKGVVASDYNNDGWPDIFVSDFDGRRILLKNNGAKSKIPQFTDVTHEAGLDQDWTPTFPTWFWDYDNDGWPDIFVCGFDNQHSLAVTAASEALGRPMQNHSTMYLYRNNHDGTFTNVAKTTGLDRSVFAMGSNFGDVDNDGWLDMYLGTGNPDFKSLIPNRMFKNISGRQFADVTRSARVGNLQKGHGVSFADINNDGNQDIFIKVGGAYPGDGYFNSFYVNPGQNQNKWIGVLLEGVKSNRSAIGAHITVSFTEVGKKRTVYMDVNSGGSFGANPLRKEIGLGKAEIIDELIIKWPTS